MISQLVAHLAGDFVLQSQAMASGKLTSWRWAFVHAAVYSLPFAVLLGLTAPLERAAIALIVIGGTHAVIDRLALAKRWCVWYGVGFPGIWHRAAVWRWERQHRRDRAWIYGRPGPWLLPARPEPPALPPPCLGTWLIVVVDNTAHLAINATAIGWATLASA